MVKIMNELFEILNIIPKDERLYDIAVSHSSYANEHRAKKDYERLEFLGDAVVDLAIADYLYSNHNEDEGEMTKVRASYVCENALSEYANKLCLSKFVKVGLSYLCNICPLYCNLLYSTLFNISESIAHAAASPNVNFFSDISFLVLEYFDKVFL